jgi:hypothetical protein
MLLSVRALSELRIKLNGGKTMSNQTKSKRTPRACTFTVEVITGKNAFPKKQRIFTPVNKRAKRIAKLVGGGKKLTTSQLRAIKSVYGYRLLTSPDLKAIRV